METIAVFINDAAHARHILQPMLAGGQPTRWVLVACPPVFTRHIGRFVSNRAREQWRNRWALDVFAQLEPELKAAGHAVDKLVAKRPLVNESARLAARLPVVRLLDARRPRVGKIDEPITTAQPADLGSPWAAPLAITTGLSAVLALAD